MTVDSIIIAYVCESPDVTIRLDPAFHPSSILCGQTPLHLLQSQARGLSGSDSILLIHSQEHPGLQLLAGWEPPDDRIITGALNTRTTLFDPHSRQVTFLSFYIAAYSVIERSSSNPFPHS